MSGPAGSEAGSEGGAGAHEETAAATLEGPSPCSEPLAHTHAKPRWWRSAAVPAAELDWLGTSPPPPPPPPSGGSGTELLELGSVPRKQAWLRRT